MKKSITILFFLLVFFTTYTFAQPRIGITGGMNLSVLTGTVNMETGFKPGILRQKFRQLSGQVDTGWEG